MIYERALPGLFVRRGSWPRQLAVGAPRAGPKRAGAVFVVGYDGTEQVAQIGKISGKRLIACNIVNK
jgi:hypothetical protein